MPTIELVDVDYISSSKIILNIAVAIIIKATLMEYLIFPPFLKC